MDSLNIATEFTRRIPVLRSNTEGRGNKVKTVITNLNEIAVHTDKQPSEILKYLGFELGTKVSSSGDRYSINGLHSNETLTKLLNRFVSE